MSETDTGLRPGADAQAGRRPRARRRAAVASLAIVVAAGGVAGYLQWPRIERVWQGAGTAHRASFDNGSPTSTAHVSRHDLTARQRVDGTLGYAGSYTVLGGGRGVVTWLPDVGQVVRFGHVVYRLDRAPVVLLRGAVPMSRDLRAGMTGRDVAQLNADLVRLGYATTAQLDPDSDAFTAATGYAVERLQDHLGVTEDGVLRRARVVFLPTALRVTSLAATLGGPATGPILKGGSTTRQVVVKLDATRQAQVHRGDRVTVTLPDDRTTRGRVSKVGSVASKAGGSGSGGSGDDTSATVEVDIALTRPRATGHLDQAPVQVAITTDTARHALVVPVTALLALAGGGYGVEVVVPGGAHRLVRVHLGLFDDADGLVQVTHSTLRPGQTIVVAGS